MYDDDARESMSTELDSPTVAGTEIKSVSTGLSYAEKAERRRRGNARMMELVLDLIRAYGAGAHP